MFDKVLAFAKVVASAVGGVNASTTYNLAGIADFDAEGDDEGENAPEQEVFSGLGLFGRPLPPDDTDLFAEALSARTSDGLIPFAFRDLRLNKLLNPGGASSPAEGQIGIVGYGGGMFSTSLTDVDSGDAKANIVVLYCPFEFSNGVPAKGHVVTLDPTPGNESVSVVHADGPALTLTSTGVQIKNAAGDVYVELNGSEIVLNGNVNLNGAVALGNLVANFPLAKSAELITWAALVNGALSSLSFPIAPLSASVATTLVKGT